MEIRGKTWVTGHPEPVSTIEYVNPVVFTDPIVAIKSTKERLIERLTTGRAAQMSSISYSMFPGEFDFIVNGVKEKALKEGRKEAWDLARRVVTYGPDCYAGSDFDSVFGSNNALSVFSTPVEEALSKDKKHQENKRTLHVGDEVKFRNADKACGYVVKTGTSEFVTVLMKDRSTDLLRISDLAKTGNLNEDLVKGLAAFDK